MVGEAMCINASGGNFHLLATHQLYLKGMRKNDGFRGMHLRETMDYRECAQANEFAISISRFSSELVNFTLQMTADILSVVFC
jgi:hypothetical protein